MKTLCFRSSRNYIWNVNNVLGKGATGSVYNGLNKMTGESVAVKSFNHASQMRPYELQEREFEVLKKVNHQNIVKLLAIEEEVESHHKVLIMELCSGGSLFSILDDPINCLGLEEKEFVTVLEHLAAGMKHLHDNNIIHRDLKPGNIMKYIGEDGKSIYKLTDFGAARVLENGQQFLSLYGTEEYLHPDMYERAVLHKTGCKSFPASVDLWSIGVTLYHIATGSLPFKPYGGRKNKETMFKITTEKQSGIISGHQLTDNGEIIWSRHLPETCLLSPALKTLILPLLAGLMECDSTKMWSFEVFFNTVTSILNHNVVHIFHVNHMEDIVVYLNPNESLNDLKHHLGSVIPVKSALLIWNKQQIHDLLDVKCTQEDPIILLNCDSTIFRQSPILSSTNQKFQDLANTPTNFELDAQKAKIHSCVAYEYQRTVNKCVHYYQLACSTPFSVISLIESNLRLLGEKQHACSHFLNSLKNQLNYLNDVSQDLLSIVNTLNLESSVSFDSLTKAINLSKSLYDQWDLLPPMMNRIRETVKSLQENWNKTYRIASESDMSTAKERAKNYAQKIRESWQSLYKDKATRLISSSVEDQCHQLEKVKIDTNAKKLTNLLHDTCFVLLRDITKKLENWYTEAQSALKQSECLFKEFSLFNARCEELQQCLNRVREDQKRGWKSVVKLHNNLDPSKSRTLRSNITSESLEIFEQQRIKLYAILQETQNLISESNSLSTENTKF